MGDALLLADDLFRRAGATVTDDVGATSPAYLRDWRDDEQASHPFTGAWTTIVDLGVGASGRATALGLVNENLRLTGVSSVKVEVHFKALPADPWTLAFTGALPTGQDWLATWVLDAPYRLWKVTITPTGAPTTAALLGEMLLGLPVVFPYPPEWGGFDPKSEVPVGYGGMDQLPAAPFVVSYVQRAMRLRWASLPESFVEARGTPDAFRTWWEEYGSKGVPFLFAWDTDASHLEDLLWCWAVGPAPRRFATPPDWSYTGWPPPTVGTAIRSLDLAVAGRRR